MTEYFMRSNALWLSLVDVVEQDADFDSRTVC